MIIICDERCEDCEAKRCRLETFVIIAPRDIWPLLGDLREVQPMYFHDSKCPKLAEPSSLTPEARLIELCDMGHMTNRLAFDASIKLLSAFDAAVPDSVRVEVKKDGCSVNNITSDYPADEFLAMRFADAIIAIVDKIVSKEITLSPSDK